MSKELEALKNIKQDYCKYRMCPQSVDACKMCDIGIIETALKNYEQIKKCHLVAIPRMSNKTSVVDELLSLQEAIRVMTTILHYSYTNRFIVKQAFDEGWINEAQYQLMIETFGYYNCTGKEEPK